MVEGRKFSIMKQENENIEKQMPEQEVQEQDVEQTSVDNQENTAEQGAPAEEHTEADELETLRARVAELEDLKLRQMAEFDNYRRRTNKEKLDLMATAGERIFREMLPLIDDFERAATHGDLSEGGQLIYKKFLAFLESQGVTAIETTDADFDTDLHEAITTFAAGEDKKGKIIDCTQRGYKLGEKVIRYSKVVVGE